MKVSPCRSSGTGWPVTTCSAPAPSPPTAPLPSRREAYEAARIEAGFPRHGAELDERTIPAEAGLVEASVSFTKGCYTGQELVARIDSRGSNVPRHLRGLVLSGPAQASATGLPSSRPVNDGTDAQGGRPANQRRSFSPPRLGGARLRRSRCPGGRSAVGRRPGWRQRIGAGTGDGGRGTPIALGRDQPVSEVQANQARTANQANGGGRAQAPGPAPVALSRSFDRLAMFTFVTLGLPDGMIGTAWPTLRHRFGVPLGDLGLILLVGTLGGLASSSVAGLLFARTGARFTIILGALAGAGGALGIAFSPTFWVFVISGTAIGVAAGLFDSTVNTTVALAGRNRLLNFLHGCYGVGSSIGPLVITGALLAGSWRGGYGVLAGVEGLLVFGWWAAGRQLGLLAPPPPPASASVPPTGPHRPRPWRRSPARSRRRCPGNR